MLDKLSPNTRLLIAGTISMLIVYIWQWIYVEPLIEEQEAERKRLVEQTKLERPAELAAPAFEQRSELLSKEEHSAKRVTFENKAIKGSINLQGARIDDLVMKKYRKTLDENSDNVELLSPSKTKDSYFVEFGWLSDKSDVDVPNATTVWHAKQTTVEGISKTVLTSNVGGVEYVIEITLDDNYLFHVKQIVRNHSGRNLALHNYALVNRNATVSTEDNMVIHEGAIGVIDGKLVETKYDDIAKARKIEAAAPAWLGFSDKYWLTALLPTDKTMQSKLSYVKKNEVDKYQASVMSLEPAEIGAGKNYEWQPINVFAGAKELDLLDQYELQLDAKLFDRSVDFGVLYFITKPIFLMLHWFHTLVGNFGIAILLLTVVIKLILFPLAHKGFRGMNRLKELQPKMEELKQRYKDDTQGFQRALIELYKKEKVNPLGGCMPILLQIPVFFALYKVLYVSIEMRHAPFFGWIQDLSVAETVTVTNLFGLIPWDPPSFLMIGVFPILMAVTMYIQQKLNPEPTDPTQAMVMKMLPWVFLFMFASFPAGLVIYWTWSNVLSIMQQVLIKKLETGPIKN